MKRTITQLILTVIAMPIFLTAQSPENLNTDIEWIAGFDDATDIEEAYNFGRRGEENQLGLAAESLGFLTLPTDWNAYTISQKALYIINDERTSRSGLDYGNGPVLGLPLDALEDNLSNLAQNHADWLLANNEFSHTGENNWGPFERIDNDPVLGDDANCHEFLTRAENLAGFWTSSSSTPMPIEQAIYGWIYEGTASNWGHRQAVLLQDQDLSSNPWGFGNDYSSPSSEGFLGVGMIEAVNGDYNPLDFGSWVNNGTLVVVKILDPVSNGSCNYQMPAAAPGVLPIELTDFYGRKKEQTVDLTWLTAMEANNAYFSIQYSQNGKDFAEIGTVAGSGHSQIMQTYHFNHKNPANGINYYRLQQFDTDGTSSFSKIIAIRYVKDWEASIYPNPVVNDFLNINLTAEDDEEIEVAVFNTGNQLVTRFNINLEPGLNREKLTTTDLAKGFYTMAIFNHQKTEVLRFSKN
jgi:hypothetical protein